MTKEEGIRRYFVGRTVGYGQHIVLDVAFGIKTGFGAVFTLEVSSLILADDHAYFTMRHEIEYVLKTYFNFGRAIDLVPDRYD